MSGKAWRFHVLETRLFLLGRGLKPHSVMMFFLHERRELSQHSVCWGSYTAYKCLLGGHFSVSISPETEIIGKVPTLTGNGKATSHHLFHQVFFCRRDPASLGLSGYFVEMRDTPWVSTWIFALDGKIRSFHLVDHKAWRPSNCLKIHPIGIFSLLTGLIFLLSLALLKETRALKPLTSGPFAVECHLN